MPAVEGDPRWDCIPAVWEFEDISYSPSLHCTLDGRIVLAGCDSRDGEYGRIRFSSDGGVTWTKGGTGLHPNRRLSGFLALRSGKMFVSFDSGGVFGSVDGGTTWSQMNNLLTDIETVGLAVDADERIYAADHSGSVFRSFDYCRTWETCSGDPVDSYLKGALSCGEAVFVYNYSNIFYSLDSGESWSPMNEGLDEGSSIFRVYASPSGILYCACIGGAVLRADGPGDSWEIIHEQYGDGQVGALAAGDGGMVYLSWRIPEDSTHSTTDSTIVTTDGGLSWVPAEWGMGGDFALSIIIAPDKVYAVSSDARLLWSAPGDTCWYSFGDRFLTITSLLAEDGELTVRTGRNIFRRILDGEGWIHLRRLDTDCYGWFGFKRYVNNQLITRTPGGALLVAGCSLEISKDDGRNWESIDQPGSASYTLETGPDGSIFIATDDGIARSDDECASWVILNETLDEVFEIRAPGEGAVYAATTKGLFVSDDNGYSWRLATSAEPVYSVDADLDHVVAAATADSLLISCDGAVSWLSLGPTRYLESFEKVMLSGQRKVGVYTNFRKFYIVDIDEPGLELHTAELPRNAIMVEGDDGHLYYFQNLVHRSVLPFDQMAP